MFLWVDKSCRWETDPPCLVWLRSSSPSFDARLSAPKRQWVWNPMFSAKGYIFFVKRNYLSQRYLRLGKQNGDAVGQQAQGEKGKIFLCVACKLWSFLKCFLDMMPKDKIIPFFFFFLYNSGTCRGKYLPRDLECSSICVACERNVMQRSLFHICVETKNHQYQAHL